MNPLSAGAQCSNTGEKYSVRSSMVSPSGLATTIYVNDDHVVSLLQGELSDGRVGVVTHWSKGRFDDLSVTQFIVRHPR